MLDKPGSELVDENMGAAAAATGGPGLATIALAIPMPTAASVAAPVPQVAYKDHQVYGIYFKMASLGLPRSAVQSKMVMNGVDPNVFNFDPCTLVGARVANEYVAETEKASRTMVPFLKYRVKLIDHPVYGKYFKALKAGIKEPEEIKVQMNQEGIDPAFLDQGEDHLHIAWPEEQDLAESNSDKVALYEHPVYSKYFKMLTVGIAKTVVKTKMTKEGLDSSIIDRDPTEVLSLHDGAADVLGDDVAGGADKRKKKLHWKAIDYNKMAKGSLKNSLWAGDDDSDDDIIIDKGEFEQFFVAP